MPYLDLLKSVRALESNTQPTAKLSLDAGTGGFLCFIFFLKKFSAPSFLEILSPRDSDLTVLGLRQPLVPHPPCSPSVCSVSSSLFYLLVPLGLVLS